MSAGDTTVDWARSRLRPAPFLVRMWLLKALARLNFPEAVFLNRLAAPRWVFSFGMGPSVVAGTALFRRAPGSPFSCPGPPQPRAAAAVEIGRASCRERG